jgi:hypothetical protein
MLGAFVTAGGVVAGGVVATATGGGGVRSSGSSMVISVIGVALGACSWMKARRTMRDAWRTTLAAIVHRVRSRACA